MAKNREIRKPKKEKQNINPAGSLPMMEAAQEIAPGKKKKNTY